VSLLNFQCVYMVIFYFLFFLSFFLASCEERRERERERGSLISVLLIDIFLIILIFLQDLFIIIFFSHTPVLVKSRVFLNFAI